MPKIFIYLCSLRPNYDFYRFYYTIKMCIIIYLLQLKCTHTVHLFFFFLALRSNKKKIISAQGGKVANVADFCDTMSWIYTHTCIHTCVCVCTHTCVRVCMHIYIYIYAHAHVCAHAHIHTATHTYTHIYMWQDELDSAWVSKFKC